MVMMVAVLALAGGACGGDDDGEAVVRTDESSGDDSAADDDPSGAWCELARDLEDNTPFDDIDITDPLAVESAYEEVLSIMDDAADSAPDEIKADFAIVVANATRAVEALKAVNFDFNVVDQSIFDDPEADAAGKRLDLYGQRVCGFESDTGDVIEATVPDINGDDDTGTTDLNDDNGSFDEDTARAEIIPQLIAVGLTEVQATCIVDNVADLEDFAQTGASDQTEFRNLVETCEIDPDLLTPPGG
jgi:hypothetical protein